MVYQQMADLAAETVREAKRKLLMDTEAEPISLHRCISIRMKDLSGEA
jgi:hypothetical protein